MIRAVMSNSKRMRLFPTEARVREAGEQQAVRTTVGLQPIAALQTVGADARYVTIQTVAGTHLGEGDDVLILLHELLLAEYPTGRYTREEAPTVVTQQFRITVAAHNDRDQVLAHVVVVQATEERYNALPFVPGVDVAALLGGEG